MDPMHEMQRYVAPATCIDPPSPFQMHDACYRTQQNRHSVAGAMGSSVLESDDGTNIGAGIGCSAAPV